MLRKLSCILLKTVLTFCCRNALERQFLQILQFNTNVPPSVYAKYYFDLRALADKNEMDFSLSPLSKERAVKLEVGIQMPSTFLEFIRSV